MNYGFKVKIEYIKGLGKKSDTIRNVTEIHYNFRSYGLAEKQIAFESDIHGTGCTKFVDEIKEFTAILETGKAKSF